MDDRPLILLTNDDGIQAEGLNALREALLPFARTVIVAPAVERSASSHSITLQRPLRYKRIDTDVFSLDGTPADCVYMALFSDCFLPTRPDLVLAGINHGLNLGTDIFYSGTVGAAREAAIHGVSAMALSYDDTKQFAQVADLSVRLTLNMLDAVRSSDSAALLNVNVPKGSIKGGVMTSLSRRYYQDNVVVRQDPRGHEYLWIGGRAIENSGTKGTDVEAVNQGYFSITALAMEATDTNQFEVAQRVAASCLECPNALLSATERRNCEG
jgi:5'-nucleotidase